MLRVHLQHRFERLGWDVYVLRMNPERTELASIDDRGDLVFDRAAVVGERLPDAPTLHLREDVLRALVAAATDELPADGSMAAHLDDAQAVRDRLLAMIEKRGIR